MKAKCPVIRISKGAFPPDRLDQVSKLIDDSATTLVPEIPKLRGPLYYHATGDSVTCTVVNVSVWDSVEDAKQMDTPPAILAHVRFLNLPA